MDLFLETPQQQAERMLRQQRRLIEMQMQGVANQAPVQNVVPAAVPAAVPGCESAPEAYSVQQDSYAQELAFDKRRARRRRVGQRLRTLAMIVLIPLGLAAIFLASYALTCILNGASPNEVLQHLAALGQRLGDVATTIAPAGRVSVCHIRTSRVYELSPRAEFLHPVGPVVRLNSIIEDK